MATVELPRPAASPATGWHALEPERVLSALATSAHGLSASVLAIGLWTNPTVYLGIGMLLVLQLGFVYLPFMQDLFGSAGLAADAWIAALAVSLVVLPVITIEKRLRQRRRPAA